MSKAIRELRGEVRAAKKLGVLRAMDGLTTREQRQEILRTAIEAVGPDTLTWKDKTWRDMFKMIYGEEFRS